MGIIENSAAKLFRFASVLKYDLSWRSIIENPYICTALVGGECRPAINRTCRHYWICWGDEEEKEEEEKEEEEKEEEEKEEEEEEEEEKCHASEKWGRSTSGE